MRNYIVLTVLTLGLTGCLMPASVKDAIDKLNEDFPKIVAASQPADGVDKVKFDAATAAVSSTLALLKELAGK